MRPPFVPSPDSPDSHAGIDARTTHVPRRTPVEDALIALQTIDPMWRVEIGVPEESPDWIPGTDLLKAAGPFHALLERIGICLRTDDRKTIAASFALRFGWSSSAAIGPYLVSQCVPEVGLENLSLKFRDNTFFERTAIHIPRGTVLRSHASSGHPLTAYVQDPGELLHVLRVQLREQARPVIEALYQWSGFSRRGTWGQVTSSWAAQFVNVCGRLRGEVEALTLVEDFFRGEDDVARMRPRLHPVTLGGIVHVHQRRASCCRYYLLPHGSLCASCPLVPHEERLARNLAFMKRRLNGVVE